MRVLSLAFVATIALGALATAPAAQAAPEGSYRSSCTNWRTDGDILTAQCPSNYGWRTSRLDFRRCGGDIANQNGYLVCRSGREWGRGDDDGDRWGDDRRGDGDRDGDRWDGDGRRGDGWGGGGWGDRGDRWGRITLFAGPAYTGPALPASSDMWNLDSTRFNDRAASVRIDGGTWILCEDAGFRGRCVTLNRSEPNLARLGMYGRVSSLRRVGR